MALIQHRGPNRRLQSSQDVRFLPTWQRWPMFSYFHFFPFSFDHVISRSRKILLASCIQFVSATHENNTRREYPHLLPLPVSWFRNATLLSWFALSAYCCRKGSALLLSDKLDLDLSRLRGIISLFEPERLICSQSCRRYSVICRVETDVSLVRCLDTLFAMFRQEARSIFTKYSVERRPADSYWRWDVSCSYGFIK